MCEWRMLLNSLLRYNSVLKNHNSTFAHFTFDIRTFDIRKFDIKKHTCPST